MSTPFADPAPSSSVDFNTLQGRLLMFEVIAAEDHIPTVNTKPGEQSPAIRANITIVDGPQAGTLLENALVFPKMLQGQLRTRIGKLVLGRLTQGPAQPGKNAPWVLSSANENDRRQAESVLSSTTPATAAPVSNQAHQGTSEPPF